MFMKETSNEVRDNKKKRVLQCIMDNSSISRSEIAERIHLSKPTVSALVDELIQESWVREQGIGKSTSQGGRKPIKLEFNEKAAYVIGTDIGGTKVKTILSDLGGNIVASSNFITSQYLKTGVLRQISKEVEAMIEESGIDSSRILGMGAGVPGITDTENGVVIEAPSLDWVRYPFLAEAKKYFPYPVYVDNDVNVAALGEQWLGNAKNKENVMFIAVGTGIGSAIIIHNRLYRGSSSAAGEIGYMVTDKQHIKSDFQPVFHRYGYLESVAGGKAIGDRLTKAIRQQPDHPYHKEAVAGELPGEMAFKLAKADDRLALEVVEESIEHLAYGVINAASLLNPEVIIFGGGVLKSADFILPRLKETVSQYLPSPVELKISSLRENAGVIGSVSMFLREHESIIKTI